MQKVKTIGLVALLGVALGLGMGCGGSKKAEEPAAAGAENPCGGGEAAANPCGGGEEAAANPCGGEAAANPCGG